jgi:hypothetical protein
MPVGKRRYRRQEKSLQAKLHEHTAKIEGERAKSFPNEGLIGYWEREVRAFQMGIVRARIRRRGRS